MLRIGDRVDVLVHPGVDARDLAIDRGGKVDLLSGGFIVSPFPAPAGRRRDYGGLAQRGPTGPARVA